jgi:hypothetical protein
MLVLVVLGLAVLFYLFIWRRRAALLRSAWSGKRIGGKGYYTYTVYK